MTMMMTMTTLITNGDDDDVHDYEYNDRDQCCISCVESRSSKPLRATSDLTFGSLSKRRCVSLRMSKMDSKLQKRILRFFTKQINPRSLGSECIIRTDESALCKDSSQEKCVSFVVIIANRVLVIVAS